MPESQLEFMINMVKHSGSMPEEVTFQMAGEFVRVICL